MQLIRQSHAGNLIHNDETGFLKYGTTAADFTRYLPRTKAQRLKRSERIAGETWKPTGKQGSK